ncbi:TonB-dependent receptor [Chitinophaga sp. MM2321]|uniref:TonB-dependent receptor n=1 Tax=Chitinophaga sp. MM2321 TaxID=3137178 RepID=UPI0032D579BC
MKRYLSFLLLFNLYALLATAQQTGTFSGQVLDNRSAPIAGAVVRLLNTNSQTNTDINGHFSLGKLAAGAYNVEISAEGSATINQIINVPQQVASPVFKLAAANVQLDEIIVTAQKTEEELQQVPVSITAISAAQVREYGLQNIKDITAIVPNLYSANPGDNRNVTSIRGITTTSYDPAVTTYVDGVNQFGLDTYISQLLDIERIEVLRGPQGMLYGRNAMGGVINIITRKPDNSIRGFARADVGEYGQQRYSLGVSAPLIKNRLFFGVSGLYAKQNGFYINDFNGKRFDRQENIMGNYYLKYLSLSGLSVILNVKNNENRNDGTFPLASSMEEALTHPFRVNQDAVTRMTDNLFNASLSINQAGDKVNFSSQTAYQSNYRFYKDPIDGDFSPLDAISIVNNFGKDFNKVKVVSQEFRLMSAAAESPFKWSAGAYGFYQDNPVKQAIRFGKDALLTGAPDTDFSLISTSKGKGYGMAVYAQGTYTLAKKWALTLGTRYDYEHKQLNVLGEYEKGNDLFATRPDTSGSAGFNAFSPHAGLQYFASGNTSLFVTYSRGFRAGGLTPLSSDPTGEPPLFPYQPEYSNNFEVGAKNRLLDDRLSINISAFYTKVNNAQVPTLILPDAVNITRNTGSLTSKGAELEVAAKPVKDFTVAYNFGFTNAKFDRLKISQNGAEVDLGGKYQIYTPKVTSMLALQYEYAPCKTKKLKIRARGEWRYLDKQYFDLANTLAQPAYSLLNANLGLITKQYEIICWIRNLTDKRYIDYAYDFGAAHLGNPRNIGVTVNIRLSTL